MERKRFNKDLALLPRYFKKIGVAILVLASLASIFFLPINASMPASQKNLALMFTYDMFIIGLLFISFSKDKIEDEMNTQLRLRAMAFTFIWVVLSVILTPIINLIFKDQIEDSAREIVFTMLIFYLGMYYFQKLAR
jgi:hypothetical protein